MASSGINKLKKITKTIFENNRSYKGFHFLINYDQMLFVTIASREFNISGFQNKHLRQKFAGKTSSQNLLAIKKSLEKLLSSGLWAKGHGNNHYRDLF